MSLTEVIKKMEEKAGQQRKLERERLEEIAAVTSLQFAEQAAGIRTDVFLKLQGGEKFDKEKFKRIPGTEKKTGEVKE